jgi:uncharacterized protein
MNHQYLDLPEFLFETSAVGNFSGEVALPEITMGADIYRFQTPLHYNLVVTNTGGAFLVTGTVLAQAETACARCLSKVELELNAEVEAYFVLSASEEESNEDEEVEYENLEEGNKIDLTNLCQASLALSFPYIPLCSPDCAGLCPQCGANLNKETCNCVPSEDEPCNNPFAVLKNYKFDE